MKFAHEFREALLREGYPQFWVDTAIPYGQLKKCLKKIQQELDALGLEPETLRQLLDSNATSPQGQTVPLAKYKLACSDSRTVRPELTVYVQLDGGVAVDASLTPATRRALQKLVAGSRRVSEAEAQGLNRVDSAESTAPADDVPTATQPGDALAPILTRTVSNTAAGVATVERIEVPLNFDGEFFELLQTDLAQLDKLQRQEDDDMNREIVALRQDISEATKPRRFHKSDLAIWRELFELYSDAQIFFSSHERDHGTRSSAKALSQLVWFQDQIQLHNLPERFRLPSSHLAYSRFLALNATLLKRLKFQEINQRAVAKIMKKFDKQTSLGAATSFSKAMPADSFLASDATKKICAQVSDELVTIVPRVDDHTCPICLSIAWLPVRLACEHVFCIRCVVKMQNSKKRQCPLCRKEVVMAANLDNIDNNLVRYMEKYFKAEVKKKQRADDIERGIETFGPSYKHTECTMM